MCNSPTCNHDDDLSDIFGVERTTPVEIEQGNAMADANLASAQRFADTCHKCHGRGRFIGWSGRDLGQCFACKGEGKLYYKTSAEDRAKAREQAATRKVETGKLRMNVWTDANPENSEWLTRKAPTFEFAASLLENLRRYGDLTEAQNAVVTRLRLKDAERDAERAQRMAAPAPAMNVDKLAEAFAVAKRNLIKWPKIRLAGFIFSLAGENSANAGAIYVKAEDGTYLGKVMGGAFSRSRDCPADLAPTIAAAATDPESAAAAYGLQTGRCSCCGRELTNAESVGLGIGPICREKFGW